MWATTAARSVVPIMFLSTVNAVTIPTVAKAMTLCCADNREAKSVARDGATKPYTRYNMTSAKSESSRGLWRNAESTSPSPSDWMHLVDPHPGH